MNGCLKEEISIQKGLKQGVPLAYFLFLLVVESLSGLLKMVVSIVVFEGFKVGFDGLEVSHL